MALNHCLSLSNPSVNMETLNLKKEKKQAFKRYLFQGLSYLFAATSVAFIILLFYEGYFVYKLIAAIVFAALYVALRAVIKSHLKEDGPKRKSQSWIFFDGLKIFIFVILVSGILGVFQILTTSECGACAVYQALGLGIVIVWACAFLSYFVWAVHFYNISLGITDGGWKKITEAKNRKANGETYSVEDIEADRKFNPYSGETFGLPPGTVRGMIAFTLLFGAIAMLIVSIGMENQLDVNAMFWDQYEFYKTAFLMMIAFYFGNSALKYLKDRNKPVFLGDKNNMKSQDFEQSGVSNFKGDAQQEQELDFVNPMENSEDKTAPKSSEKDIKPGESTFDPMNPKA